MNTTDRCTQGDLGFSEHVITFTVGPAQLCEVHKSITIQLLSVLDLLEQSIKGKQTPQNNICPNFLSFLQGS